MSENYIYIITNESWPEWIKIGAATKPKARLDQYQTGCPFRTYKMEYYKQTSLVTKIERYFRDNVLPRKHEWYNIDIVKAIDIIELIIRGDIIIKDTVYDKRKIGKPRESRIGIRTFINYLYFVTNIYSNIEIKFTKMYDAAKYIGIAMSAFNYKIKGTNNFAYDEWTIYRRKVHIVASKQLTK